MGGRGVVMGGDKGQWWARRSVFFDTIIFTTPARLYTIGHLHCLPQNIYGIEMCAQVSCSPLPHLQLCQESHHQDQH